MVENSEGGGRELFRVIPESLVEEESAMGGTRGRSPAHAKALRGEELGRF